MGHPLALEAAAKSKLEKAERNEEAAIQRVDAAKLSLAKAQGGREAVAARLNLATQAIKNRKPGLAAIRELVVNELSNTPAVRSAKEMLEEASKTSKEATSLGALLTSWQGLLAITVIVGSVVVGAAWEALEARLTAAVAAVGTLTLALRQAREVLATARANVTATATRIDEANRAVLQKHLVALKQQLGPLLDDADQALGNAMQRMAEAQTELVELTSSRDQATSELADAAAALSSAARAQQASRAEVERTRKQLAETSAGWLLDSFLQDRLRTEDYKKELGFMALVRRDFERLNDLIASANANFLAKEAPVTTDAKPAPSERALQRIVLYIDDLDRCNEKTVAEVLQAVHLLLAFPLFVCVVAVDPRWVGRCLQKHFPELLFDSSSSEAGAAGSAKETAILVPATVADYLEKIFQIPIWMPPIEPTKRADIVKALLGPADSTTVAEPSRDTEPGSSAPEPTSDSEQRKVALVPRRSARRGRQLLIAEAETSFVSELGPILSDRPRILKRFVNTYRLLKASLPDDLFDGFVSAGPDSAHKICLVELALLLSTSAQGAKRIVSAIRTGAKEKQSIAQALEPVYAERKEIGASPLTLPQGVLNVEASDFAIWIDRTSRYLFL